VTLHFYKEQKVGGGNNLEWKQQFRKKGTTICKKEGRSVKSGRQ
jgi:hypothetical protein